MIALILAVALEVGVDGRMAVELAKKENSTLSPATVSAVNKDGSVDCGIMQLNSRYMGLFVKNYWDKEGEFDWRIPEHNIYVGLRHFRYLLSIPGFDEKKALMAYNCGESRVRSGNPPSSSVLYADDIYNKWRGE
jgi:hypothetical protein